MPGIPVPIPNPAQLASAGTTEIRSLLWAASKVPPKWGVFDADTQKQVLFPDSVLEFGYRKEYRVSTFPIQGGSFANYNKVTQPWEIQLKFSKSGSVTDRQKLLQNIEALIESLAICDIRVPEGTYYNCNAYRFEVSRRGAQGAFWLTEVEVYFIQIMEVSAQYTNTQQFYLGISPLTNAQSAAAQPVANQGNTQPQTPNSAQTTAASNAMASVISSRFF